MGKYQNKKKQEEITKMVISKKSKEELLQARNFIKLLLERKRLKKLYGTYIKGTKRSIKHNEENKVYYEMKLTGTVTGRLSCAAPADSDSGISFHTLPRDKKPNIRSLYKPPEGYCFLTVDQKAMELRVTAHLSDDPSMIQAFNDGLDLHSYTASKIYNIPYSQVDKNSIQRQTSKSGSFLVLYGGASAKLAYDFNIPLREADDILRSFYDLYKEVDKLKQDTYKYITDFGYAKTIFNRRRNLPNIRSPIPGIVEQALRQGFNATIQSASSDILLCSYIGCGMRFREKGLQTKIVACVHDSLEFVAKIEELEESLQIIYNEMVNYRYLYDNFGIIFKCPFDIEALVGHSFGDGEEVEFYSTGRVKNMDKILEYLNT